MSNFLPSEQVRRPLANDEQRQCFDAKTTLFLT